MVTKSNTALQRNPRSFARSPLICAAAVTWGTETITSDSVGSPRSKDSLKLDGGEIEIDRSPHHAFACHEDGTNG